MPAAVATVASNNGTSNYTVAVPAGTTNGDLLIGVVASDWNTLTNNSLPAGSWTALGTSDYDGGSNQMHIGLWYRIASSEPANYTVSIGGGADSVAAILRITGADGTPTIAQVAPTAFSAGTGTMNAPTITPNGADDLLLTFHSADGANGGGTLTWTAPSGMTEQVDRQSTTWTSLIVSSLQNPSSPSGAKAATSSPTNHGKGAGCTISIKSAGGGSVTGTASGAFGFTSTASGVPRTSGAATASFGFTATAQGVDRALGQASGSFGFTASASGTSDTPPVTGAAAAAFGFTATASGVPRTSGTAVAAFGFTGTAQGVDRALGTAVALFGFTSTAAGRPRVVGLAVAGFGFTATTTGTPRVRGTATGTFGFTATAQGFAGSPPTLGAASGLFGFVATAQGQPRTPGAASAGFGFTATATGRPRVVGVATSAFGFTAAGVGDRKVYGVTVAAFGFTATILGTVIPPVTFGTASAGVGDTPASHPNEGLAALAVAGTTTAPTATAGTAGAPTSTGG